MKTSELKEIIETLYTSNVFDYGAVISQQEIYSTFNLEPPKRATHDEWQAFTLLELQVTGSIREHLLNHGKYLKKDGSNYRVLLPSENRKQHDDMLDQATRKVDRAEKLMRNMPHDATVKQNTSASLLFRSDERNKKRNDLIAGV